MIECLTQGHTDIMLTQLPDPILKYRFSQYHPLAADTPTSRSSHAVHSRSFRPSIILGPAQGELIAPRGGDFEARGAVGSEVVVPPAGAL